MVVVVAEKAASVEALPQLRQRWHVTNPGDLSRNTGPRCPCAVLEVRADEKPVHSGQWSTAGIREGVSNATANDEGSEGREQGGGTRRG